MLSVLIPVYNYDIRCLVQDLQVQASKTGVVYEIIVLDDASNNHFKTLNKDVCSLDNVVYLIEEKNLGRSKIRNKLANIAKYENLLYLDCDSGLANQEYIKNYLARMKHSQVIYGGRLYAKHPVKKTYKLHWLYGVKREQSPARERSIAPNRSFQTNNFLIKKTLLQSIGFNESIKGYGHEDTLFGFELKKRNIEIVHIENPVVHLGLEHSEEFLRKTREGIKNLKRIMKLNGNEKCLASDITILSYYKKIERLHLSRPIELLYKRYEHLLRKNLIGQNPKLLLFDFYKLGYLCTINQEV